MASGLKTLALIGLLVVAVTTAEIAAQSTNIPDSKPDELNFRGNQQQGTDGAATPDTTIFNNDQSVTPSENQNGAYNQQKDNDGSSPRPRPRPVGPHGPWEQRPRPQGPLDFMPQPSFLSGLRDPFDDIFGGQSPRQRPRPLNSLFNMLGGGIFSDFNRRSREIDNEFSQLERQASEGQDVSYFNRNGVAYMRTCTTRRVSPDGRQQQQQQQSSNLPTIPDDRQIDSQPSGGLASEDSFGPSQFQQQQQQQQPQIITQ